MRLDAKGVIRFLDKTTGDGSEISLGPVCCSDFTSNFHKLLGGLFDGKIVFSDVDSDGDGKVDVYSGIKAVFIDVNNESVIETPLDGTNGKVDIIDTGYSKILRFKGTIDGDGNSTSQIFIAKVAFLSIAISTNDMKTPVSIPLGVSDAPSKSALAQTDSTTGKKGIIVVPAETKFEFVLSIELR